MSDALSNIDLVINNLFRDEAGRLVSVLTKLLGPANLEVAEDVVQDAIVEAINQWEYKGVPENPTGWMYKVAKFKALNILKHEKTILPQTFIFIEGIPKEL